MTETVPTTIATIPAMTGTMGNATETISRLPGDPPAAASVARMIRVDHAGEYAAVRIYQGQLAALRARGKAEQATRSARPRVSRGVGGDAAGRVYAPHGAWHLSLIHI